MAAGPPSEALSDARARLATVRRLTDERELRAHLEAALVVLEGQDIRHLLSGTAPQPDPAAASPDGEAALLATELLSRLGDLLQATGDLYGAERAFRVGLERAEATGRDDLVFAAIRRQAIALAEVNHHEEARRLLERLRDHAEDGSTAGLAQMQRARCLLELGRLLEAEREADGLRNVTGPPAVRAEAVMLSAWTALLGGRLRDCLRLADDARREAEQNALPELAVEAHLVLGLAETLTGAKGSGLARLADARARLEQDGSPGWRRWARLVEAEARLAAEEPQAAFDLAAEAGSSRLAAPSLRWILPTLLAAEALLAQHRAQPVRDQVLTDAMTRLQQARRYAGMALRPAGAVPALSARVRRVAAELEAEQALIQARSALVTLEAALDDAQLAGPLEAARAGAALAELAHRLEGGDPTPLLIESAQHAAEAGAESFRRRLEGQRRRLHSSHSGQPNRPGQRELALVAEVSRAISTILELDPLLERIMDAIIELLHAERGFLMLYDTPQPIEGSGDDKPELRLRVARNLDKQHITDADFELSRSVVNEVRTSGRPVVVTDALNDARFAHKHSVVLLNLQSILCLPLRTTSQDFGLLYVENRSLTELFDEGHVERMLPFTSQAALALENAFAYRRIQELYAETLSVARARERILNHVSHELKTPIAIVSGSLRMLGNAETPPAVRQRAAERAQRNIQRLIAIQSEMLDIYEARTAEPNPDDQLERVAVGDLVRQLVAATQAVAPDRVLEWAVHTDAFVVAEAPRRPLELALEGLLRNAVENTPDEGRIEVDVRRVDDDLITIAVRDFGVGISVENRKHLFAGFFHTQETDRYSSKQPYHFDAGGKGLDLLRLRTFADRYGWDVEVDSERCRFIPTDGDVCPGRISACPHCHERETCLNNGRTEFRLTLSASAGATGAHRRIPTLTGLAPAKQGS